MHKFVAPLLSLWVPVVTVGVAPAVLAQMNVQAPGATVVTVPLSVEALALVLVPTETVPAHFAATAIGLTALVGEVFGGALAPTIAGAIADRYGLAAPLWIAAGGAILVFLAAIFLTETAPSRLEAKARAASRS